MDLSNEALTEQLNALNEPQRAAVTNINGPMLVIAGAGSGKTRVLTYRIAYLLANGVKPYNILALTFTKKAAQEMKDRIAAIVGKGLASQLWMGTFHSVFAKILRFEAESLGLSPNFIIYDKPDSESIIKQIVKDMKLDDKVYSARIVSSAISSAKNDLITPQGYSIDTNMQARDKAARRTQTAAIYARYAEECKRANALDFDDLLLYTNKLFSTNAEALNKYQDKFRFLLVDEYQDTNRSQYNIIRRLVEKSRNICVVGDDAQSIYSFRGARIENILRFSNDYPDYHLYKLEQNYRSTRNIVDAANSLISQNTNQIRKRIFSAGDEGEKIHIVTAPSNEDEADFIAKEIASRIKFEHRKASDFAVLYRQNSLSRSIEEQLRMNGIPCKVFGGQAFFQRKEVKDVLAYFRLAVNKNDNESVRRVINYPARGIGDTSEQKIFAYASQNNMVVWDAMTAEHLAAAGLNKGTAAKVLTFRALIEKYSALVQSVSANEFAKEVVQSSGIINDLNAHKNDTEGKNRLDNVNELLNAVDSFTRQQTEEGEPTDIATFLTDIALASDISTDTDDRNCVSLMTIHSSKGLEFPYVYIIGVEENIFPSQLSISDPVQIEEERRLFYVAITRAMECVTITYTTSRFFNGSLFTPRPSRFIDDIDHQYCTMKMLSPSFGSGRRSGGWRERQTYNSRPSYSNNYYNRENAESEPSYTPRPTPTPRNLKRIAPTTADAVASLINRDSIDYGGQKIGIGTRIMHEAFGKGEVKNIEGRDASTKLTIEFDSGSVKHLLLKFARLKVIE